MLGDPDYNWDWRFAAYGQEIKFDKITHNNRLRSFKADTEMALVVKHSFRLLLLVVLEMTVVFAKLYRVLIKHCNGK